MLDNAALDHVCAGHDKIALAVSGGGDSLALLLMVRDWATQTARSVHVLTVDHQLRAESADEARYVAQLCADQGLSHSVLRWEDPKKQQSRARDARLRLLCDAAGDIGANVVMTGHTLDDVAETIEIRRARGTPDHRLAGPAAVGAAPVWPEGRGSKFIRPLLKLTRAQLRKQLRVAGVSWVDDPSNDDPAYERVRVRKALRADPARLGAALNEASELLGRRAEFDAALSVLLLDPSHVEIAPDGLITFNSAGLSDPLHEAALSTLIRIASGTDEMPDLSSIKRLSEVEGRATLGGAWLHQKDGTFRIGRDRGRVQGSVSNGLWDGRYAIDARAAPHGLYDYLVRHAVPPSREWTEILSERLTFEASCMALSGGSVQTL